MKVHPGQQAKSISSCKTKFHTKHIFSPLSDSHFANSVIVSSWLGPKMLLPGHSTLEMPWCNGEQNPIQCIKTVLEKLPRCNNYFTWTINKQLLGVSEKLVTISSVIRKTSPVSQRKNSAIFNITTSLQKQK